MMTTKAIYVTIPAVYVTEEFYPAIDSFDRDYPRHNQVYGSYEEALDAGYLHCASILNMSNNTTASITFSINKRIRVSLTELATDNPE
jgi:hypothetical protein